MNMTSWPILDSSLISWLGPRLAPMDDGPICTNSNLSTPRVRARVHTHTHTHTHTRLPSYINTLFIHPTWALIHCLLSFLVWEFHPSWALTPTPYMLPSNVNTFCPPLRLWHPTLGHWGSSLHLSHIHTPNGRKKIAALSFLKLKYSHFGFHL